MMYSRLGINKSSTPKEIKTAYHKLALKHHPDKTSNNENNDNHFKNIKEAYEILSDPYKRQLYDTQFIFGKNIDASFEFDEDFTKEFDIMVKQFSALIVNVSRYYKTYKDVEKKSNMENNVKETKINKTQDTLKIINVNMKVDLEDLYHARVKKVSIVTCKLDGGFKKEGLFVSLLNYKSKYEFKGLGDEIDENTNEFSSTGKSKIISTLWDMFMQQGFATNKKQNVKRGDIHINLEFEEHPFIKIFDEMSPYDLLYIKKCSLYDFLYGSHISIDLFGEKVEFKYNGGKPQMITIKEHGLPFIEDDMEIEQKGCLHVYLDLDMEVEHARIKRLGEKTSDACQFKSLMFTYCSNTTDEINPDQSMTRVHR